MQVIIGHPHEAQKVTSQYVVVVCRWDASMQDASHHYITVV